MTVIVRVHSIILWM